MKHLILLLALLPLACTSPEEPPLEFLPDMAHSVPYDTFAPNPVLPHHQTLQPPVPGTVPRGAAYLPYGPGPEEAERAGHELANPMAPDGETLARGEHLYGTFCLVCHGATGEGDGPLVPKIPAPPSYRSASTREMPPGQIFHVITYGSGRMPSYAAQILPDDRWRLARYVEILQREEGER